MGARAVAVSYYGLDVRKFDPRTSGAGFRREFGLADDTPTVGMVAHMYPTNMRAYRKNGVKGHEVFLDAVPLILQQVPDARMFVVGDELAGNGDYRRRLEARAAALGLTDSVHFTGHRSDIASVMAGLDVAVNPSLQDSACGTMVQALLMGKGVVASNVGGLPDTVQDGETGLLVPPADPAALAAAVTKLLTDPVLRLGNGQPGARALPAPIRHRRDRGRTREHLLAWPCATRSGSGEPGGRSRPVRGMNRIPLPLIVKAVRDLRAHWYPVEAEIHPDGRGRYPIDLTLAGRQFRPGADGMVMVAGPDGRDYYNPVSACLYALARHTQADRADGGQRDGHLAAFLGQAGHLRLSQDASGGWRYPIPVARSGLRTGLVFGDGSGHGRVRAAARARHQRRAVLP